MSTANDLLSRALSSLQFDLSAKECVTLMNEIVEYLHQPEPIEPEADKPVAWQSLTDDEVWEISKQNGDDYEYFRAIEERLKEKNHQPRPEPSRKPMTEEEWMKIHDEWMASGYALNTRDFVRAIEKHHNIK